MIFEHGFSCFCVMFLLAVSVSGVKTPVMADGRWCGKQPLWNLLADEDRSQ
jgi:hypothetical protein